MSAKHQGKHPQGAREHAAPIDEHLIERDKQSLQSNPHDQPMIAEAGVNPALRTLREHQEHQEQQSDTDVTP